MMMFKRTKANNAASATGSGEWPPRMPLEVYARNGICYRPPPPPPSALRSGVHATHGSPSAAAHAPTRPGCADRRQISWTEPSVADRPDPPLRSSSANDRPLLRHYSPSRRRALDAQVAEAAPAPPPTTTRDPITVTVTSGVDEQRSDVGNDEAEQTPSAAAATSGRHRWNPFRRIKNKKKKVVRVYINVRRGWQPGQKIRVLTADGSVLLVAIPPRSDWVYENENDPNPFFRMDFDPSAPVGMTSDPCICVPSLGVYDSSCPRHGTLAQEYGSDADDVSIAQEEGGDDPAPVETTPAVITNNPGWECKSCVTLNPVQNGICSACGVSRPGAFRERGGVREQDMLPATLELTKSPPRWECKSCVTMNAGYREACSACGMQRPRGAAREGREMQPSTLDLTDSKPARKTPAGAERVGATKDAVRNDGATKDGSKHDEKAHAIATGVGATHVGTIPVTTTRRGLGWECKCCNTVNVAPNEACRFCRERRHGEIRELDIPSATARYEAKLYGT